MKIRKYYNKYAYIQIHQIIKGGRGDKVPFGKFHRIGGAPPETFPNVI